MTVNKGAVKRISATDRQRQALELRKGGATLQEIAERVGYAGASGAAHAIGSALKRTIQAPADELRALELDRLDALHAAVWPQAVSGHLGAVDRALKVMERRAKLLGLDGSSTLRIEGSVLLKAQLIADELGLSVEEVLAESERVAVLTDGKEAA